MNTELFITNIDSIIENMEDEDKQYIIYRYQKKYRRIGVYIPHTVS